MLSHVSSYPNSFSAEYEMTTEDRHAEPFVTSFSAMRNSVPDVSSWIH